MSKLTASQLYLDFSGVADIDPYTNPNLAQVLGGVKLVSHILSVSNAALFTGGVRVSAAHTLSTISAFVKVAYPSDLQYVYLVNPATGAGYALRCASGTLRLFSVVSNELNGSDPLTFGSTTLVDNDEVGFEYNGSTITVYLNDVSQFTYSVTDPTLRLAWNYNIDNVHAGGARALGFTYGAATSIDSITTAGNPGLVVGQSFSINTTGLGNLAEVDIQTIGVLGSTVVATSLSAPSGDGGGTMPYWIDGQKYPFPGTVRVSAVETGGTPNTADGDFTLSLPANYIDVVFSSVSLADNTYLGFALNAIGHPLANNDRGYWPNVNSLNFASNGKISVDLPLGGTMTTDLWIQKVDSTMEYYSVTINDSGAITGAVRNKRLWIGIGIGI